MQLQHLTWDELSLPKFFCSSLPWGWGKGILLKLNLLPSLGNTSGLKFTFAGFTWNICELITMDWDSMANPRKYNGILSMLNRFLEFKPKLNFWSWSFILPQPYYLWITFLPVSFWRSVSREIPSLFSVVWLRDSFTYEHLSLLIYRWAKKCSIKPSSIPLQDRCFLTGHGGHGSSKPPIIFHTGVMPLLISSAIGSAYCFHHPLIQCFLSSILA